VSVFTFGGKKFTWRLIWASTLFACALAATQPSDHELKGFALDALGVPSWWIVHTAITSFPKAIRPPWRLIEAGLVLWITGDFIWDVIAATTGTEPAVSFADLAYLAGYPCFAVGVARLIRLRSPEVDREVLLDCAGLTAAASIAAWQFLIRPSWDPTVGLLERVVGAAYPVGDLVMLAGVCLLALARGRATNALRALISFGIGTLILDCLYAIAGVGTHEATLRFVDSVFPLSYLLLAWAVQHPEAPRITDPAAREFRATNPFRFVLLGVTLYAAPLVTLIGAKPAITNLVIGLAASAGLTAVVVARFVVLVREREAMERAAAFRAFHDELTGLANRELLAECVDTALQTTASTGEGFAVLFVDLDRFKSVNDTWGHAAGDRVLKSVSETIKRCVRPGDTVARIGGDEFAVLCEGIGNAAHAELVAERIVLQLSDGLPFEAKLVSASIGIAMIDAAEPHGLVAETVLHRADLAMYEAKSTGGRSWRQFDAELREQAEQRRQVELDLVSALERGEFRLEYQPIVALNGSGCVGLEALLRWDRPNGKPIGPAEFIPIAEATGLIVPIGEWVMLEASRFASRLDFGYVTVNVSAIQLKQSDVAASFKRAIAQSGADPTRLVIELTESALATEVEHVNYILDQLVDLGPRIAVDDFGTGYSNLAYIDRFPVSIVKIDRSLVDRIDSDEHQRAVVQAISSLAAALGFSVVAEGLERESQQTALQGVGVPYGQGWLFTRSLRPDAAIHYMDTFTELNPRLIMR
jgi:diguanylate cyclase